jgi:predicted Rossmann-fold nucleotide-binding protein
VRSSDGIVAVGGSWGTLSEVALAHRLGVPVVTLNGWSVEDAASVTVPTTTALSPLAAVERVVELIEHQR